MWVSILLILDMLLEEVDETDWSIDGSLCFNPSYTGYSTGSAKEAYSISVLDRVSILLILDMLLEALAAQEKKKTITSFNPSYTGYATGRPRKLPKSTVIMSVSILLILDMLLEAGRLSRC